VYELKLDEARMLSIAELMQSSSSSSSSLDVLLRVEGCGTDLLDAFCTFPIQRQRRSMQEIATKLWARSLVEV
jgi:hypothetical protein